MANFPDNNIPSSGNPGIDGGVRMGGPVAPSDWSDMDYGFYTHWANLGKGGWQEVSTLVDRDAINEARREFGMAIMVLETGKIYVLSNTAMGGVSDDKTDNNNWIEFNLEGGNVKLTYQGDIQAGNLVSLVGDGIVAKTISKEIANLGELPNVREYNVTQYGTDKIVVVYTDSGDLSVYIVVGTVAGDGTISFNTAQQISTDSAYYPRIAYITTDAFVVTYRNQSDSGKMYAIGFSIDGSDNVSGIGNKVDLGTANYIYNPRVELAEYSSNKIFFSYRTGYTGRVLGAEIDPATLTISIGTWLTVYGNGRGMYMDSMLGYTAVMAYGDRSNGETLTVAVVEIDPATLAVTLKSTLAIGQETSTIYHNSIDLEYTDIYHMIVKAQISSTEGMLYHIRYDNINETILLEGTQSSQGSTYTESIARVSSTEIINMVRDDTEGYNFLHYTISGGTFTLTNTYKSFSNFSSSVFPVYAPNDIVLAFSGTGSSLEHGAELASSIVGKIIYGIAQEDGLDGEEHEVAIRGGIDKTQTNLSIGSYYYLTADGNLTTTETRRLIGFARTLNEMIVFRIIEKQEQIDTSLKPEKIVITSDGQTTIIIGGPITLPGNDTMLYVNGNKQEYGLDFTVDTNIQLTRLNRDFELSTGDIVEVYYN